MKITAYYSFNKGLEVIENDFPAQIEEVRKIIATVDASQCQEEGGKGRTLFSPACLNGKFREEFNRKGWDHHKEDCEYIYGIHLEGYVPPTLEGNAPFREIDFLKPDVKLGIDVQFGKYAFMVYDVCAKMTIFHNFGLINAGIEIVPTKHLADRMSAGVSYFEQVAWDLAKRGVSNIDIPVLILGIDV